MSQDLLNNTLAELSKLDSAIGKPEKQKRMVGFLMANRPFLEYLAGEVQDRLPPVIGAILPKMFPKLKKEDWWRIIPEAFWGMDESNWNVLEDFIISMVEFANGQDEHSSEARRTHSNPGPEWIGEDISSSEDGPSHPGENSDPHSEHEG